MNAGACVIVHLGSPREQVFGVLIALDTCGVTLRGLGLSSVEDWLQDVLPEATGGALPTLFYPMHRVEKVTLDEPAWGAPAVEERFRSRTGLRLRDWLLAGDAAEHSGEAPC